MWKSQGWRCWLPHNPKVDKSPPFLWPRVPLSQHLLFQQKGLHMCMCVHVCVFNSLSAGKSKRLSWDDRSRITLSQCVQLSCCVYLKIEKWSRYCPLTSYPWPHATAVLSFQQNVSCTNMCVCMYNCVVDLLPACTHAEWKKFANLAFCFWTITYTTAQEERGVLFFTYIVRVKERGRYKKHNEVILQEN